MYLKIGEKTHPARNPRHSAPFDRWRVTLLDKPDLTLPLSGKMGLYADDGFALAEVDTADYARQVYENGLLTLTNQPEPKPAPEPTEEELAAELEVQKENMIQESKAELQRFLAEHPLTWQDGETYSVTEEKQSLLTSQLALQSIAEQAGVERELKWNSTGGVCVPWTLENLSALALAIGAYVQPLVTYQQTVEVRIQACRSLEELEAVEVDYYTVYPNLRPEEVVQDE